MTSVKIKYCLYCGAPLVERFIEDDGRRRLVCSACSQIQYENPRILVACLVEHDLGVLLCQRAHEPAKGLWIVPGGFMEQGETLEQAAIRETEEETGVVIDRSRFHLHTVSNLPWISEVYVGFRAHAADPQIKIGRECIEARFFMNTDIPWDYLAFKETATYLRLYFRERAAGRFGVHLSSINSVGVHRREYLIEKVTDYYRTNAPADPL